jgi:hypothetical protein
MTPLPIIPGVMRCALNWTAGSQSAENVIHLRGSTGDPGDAFAALEGAVSTNLWGAASTSASITSVSITPLDGVTPTQEFPTSGPGWVGGTSGEWSPSAAVVVSFTTATRGRSHRGRAYLPFTCDVSNVNGELGSSIHPIMTAAWNDFQAALTSGLEHVVASYKLHSYAVVIGYAVKSGLATQRRRQTRVSYP